MLKQTLKTGDTITVINSSFGKRVSGVILNVINSNYFRVKIDKYNVIMVSSKNIEKIKDIQNIPLENTKKIVSRSLQIVEDLPKDYIHNKWPPNNPPCILSDGSIKKYSMLNSSDKVYVFEEDVNDYLVGDVVSMRSEPGTGIWRYYIKTIIQTKQRKISDFKNP